MKQEIADLWIQALKSGEYKQTRRALRQGDAFCCLGVLCDLHSKHSGEKWYMDQSGDGWYLHNTGLLPEPVFTWAGMKTSAGVYQYDVPLSLSSHNDHGMSFEHIAEIIKEHVKDL